MIKRTIPEIKTSNIEMRTKEASGFIEDIIFGDILTSAFERISDQDAFDLYKSNEWVGNTVNRIVRDCVKNEPVVVPIRKTNKVSKRQEGRIRKVQDFLWNPNKGKESFKEIREKLIRDELIYGRGGIEKVVDKDSRKLLEIYSVSGKDIRVMADKKGNLPPTKTYRLTKHPFSNSKTDNENTIWFDFDELIFVVLNPISRSLYGIKILDNIAFAVGVDILRSNYNGNFFVNGAEASGIISVPDLNKRAFRAFTSKWKTGHKGAAKSHRLAFTNSQVKFERMSLSNRDMEFGEYGKELRDKIFSGYGMQPVVMGIVDSTTGKLNSKEQINLYKEGGLRPVLEKEAYYYTLEILHMGFNMRDLKVTFPSIELADIETQTGIETQRLTAGTTYINEVRANHNEPPVDWGDRPVVLQPGGGQVNPGGTLVPPSGSKKPQKELDLFIKYFDSLKIKLNALFGILDKIKFEKCKIDEVSKSQSIKYNGKNFKLKRFTLPSKFKGCELDKTLDKIIDYRLVIEGNYYDDYMECLLSRIKSAIVSNIMDGSEKNIFNEMDRIKNDEMNYGPATVIFNGNNTSS